jgi:hypothetical protein
LPTQRVGAQPGAGAARWTSGEFGPAPNQRTFAKPHTTDVRRQVRRSPSCETQGTLENTEQTLNHCVLHAERSAFVRFLPQTFVRQIRRYAETEGQFLNLGNSALGACQPTPLQSGRGHRGASWSVHLLSSLARGQHGEPSRRDRRAACCSRPRGSIHQLAESSPKSPRSMGENF